MRSIKVDPLAIGVIICMIIPLIFPVPHWVFEDFETIGNAPIFLLFLLYGMRLSTREVLSGFTNWRLQLLTLTMTWVYFPLLVLFIMVLVKPFMTPELVLGFLYLSALPSTVNSSITFTSIAKGNIPGAITAATASNISGIFLTPMIAIVFLGATGSPGSTAWSNVLKIFAILLLPFFLGQLVQPWWGDTIRKHAKWTRRYEMVTIFFIVFKSVTEAKHLGVFAALTWSTALTIVGLSATIITLMLASTWRIGKLARMPYGDTVALMMCGSKKSLATGLPMAMVLFSSNIVGVLVIPMILFHQLQLIACAYVAQRLAATTIASNPPAQP